MVSVASCTSGAGGQIQISGGRSTLVAGGAMCNAMVIVSGEGVTSTNGAMVIQRLSAGAKAVSGALFFSTDASNSGNAGSMNVGTGTQEWRLQFMRGPSR